MTTRNYTSRSQQTTLTSAVTSGAVTIPVVSASALFGGIGSISAGPTFTVVIDPDTALEEIIDVTAYTVGNNTLTVTRSVDTVSGAQDHSAGAVVRHMIIGRDLREANTHIESTTTAHGVNFANLVKTTDTGVISSAMITDGTIVNGDISSSAAIVYSKLSLTGGIVSNDIANDTIMNADINTAAGIALTKLATDPLARANHTGTQLAATVSDFDTQVRTSKLNQMATPTAAVAMGAQLITGVADPVSAQDAATKAYVGAQITALVGGAPGTLDTLAEIASAINNSGSFATSVVLRDGTQAMTGALAMGANKITGVATPTATTDAATKAYVDAILSPPSGNLTGPITSTGVVTAVASQTGTGSKFVMDTSPTLVTPALGVATATSINATTIPSTKTLVVTTDKLSTLAATTSAELAGVISDETGSGALVFATLPTFGTTGVKLAGSVSGTTTVLSGATAGTSSLTLPVATDTLVGKATTDTLTNKTLTSPKEVTTISATAATGTIQFDVLTQGVLYYTTAAAGAFTLNVRGNSGTTLASLMNTFDSVTVVFMNTNTATAYFTATVTIDGNAQTVKWQNGTAPSAGNINATDIYTFSIFKTAATPTYTVIGSLTKFA